MRIKRRDFITLLGGAAAWPRAVRAEQPDRVRRIGILIQLSESDPEGQSRVAAFRAELQKLGWRVGSNLQVNYRWAISSEERARTATAEILKLAPDAVLANGTLALRAMQQATSMVSIVFTTVIEPVAQGFVANLAHPGGNITGFSYTETSVGGKWLDLLKEIAPRVTRVAFMFNPEFPYNMGVSHFAEEAAKKSAVQYVAAPVHEPSEIETVMPMLALEPGGGLIVAADAFTTAHRNVIIDLATRFRLPAIYSERLFAAEGGLVSYGANYVDIFRQAAIYVDRILRGEKPTDLPVQQPSKFDLVINLKAAKALGLTVSNQMQLLADEVIE
jgi:putative tryptophan/tyrosine transport system substrate-binding protein